MSNILCKRFLLFVVCVIGVFLISTMNVSANEERAYDTELDLKNASFEEPLTEDMEIPGWYYSFGEQGFSIDSELSLDGQQSLKVEDEWSGTSAGLRSERVKITAGEMYRVEAQVNLNKGSLNLYIIFFDKDGNEINKIRGNVSDSSSETNVWLPISKQAEAPENAAYAAVEVYSGVASVTTANVDNVQLSFEQQLDIKLGEPENLGEMVTASLTSSAEIGEGINGREELYFATNGDPATFYAVDAETGERLFSEPLPGSDTIWGIVSASDGNVYFSGTNNGILYRYIPEDKRIEELGENPSDEWVWQLVSSDDGVIYGATYPNSKVFSYDIATGTFEDLGTIDPNEQYARGIGVTDDYIYVGIGTHTNLYRIDRKTGVKEQVPIPNQGQSGSIANIEAYGGKLFLRRGGSTVFVLDEETHEHLNTFNYNGEIAAPSPIDPDRIYYKYGTDLFFYDLSANEVVEVEDAPGFPDAGIKRFAWIETEADDGNTRHLLAGVTNFTEYFLYDPLTNEKENIYPDIVPQGIAIHSLEFGVNDKLYMGGYHRAMSIYNPETNEIEHNNSWMQQSEGIGFMNGKVYFGTYGSAQIYRYDPSKPFDFGPTADFNPGLVKDIGDAQDRPFTLTSGDNKLFIGTIPGYGELGGALTIYDEEQDSWTTHRNIVENQSVIGLAYKDGKLFGGTSLWGGGGSTPVAEEAKIFVWDAEKGEKIAEFTPEIPGIDMEPKMIGELAFGPDGLLWGAVDGTIFAMNPETYEVVKSRVIYPSTYRHSKWRPFLLRWGEDGLLYTTLGRKITIIDPETLNYKTASAETHLMTVDKNGFLYYADGSELYRQKILGPETTIDSVYERLEKYVAEDELKHPPYKQLRNKLSQAEHHLNKDRPNQAVKHMEDFIDHLLNEGMAKFISKDARNVLIGDAETLKRHWLNR